jgi:hypothetical protein
MQPLLLEKESRNGTGATCLAQANSLGSLPFNHARWQ